MDQSDVALVDEVEEEHVRVPVTLRIGNDESQVRLDELLEGAAIVLLDQLSQLSFPRGRQARNLRDLLKIMVQEVVGLISIIASHRRRAPFVVGTPPILLSPGER